VIFPEIKNIQSSDLEPPTLPEDPFDCEVAFQTIIGSEDPEEQEAFAFSVITPVRLARQPEASWGRGKLIVASVEWAAVVQSVATLLARSARNTWAEVVMELNKELLWIPDHDREPDA
jgi:hypothetical protein